MAVEYAGRQEKPHPFVHVCLADVQRLRGGSFRLLEIFKRTERTRSRILQSMPDEPLASTLEECRCIWIVGLKLLHSRTRVYIAHDFIRGSGLPWMIGTSIKESHEIADTERIVLPKRIVWRSTKRSRLPGQFPAAHQR